jgi:hypothetical protein
MSKLNLTQEKSTDRPHGVLDEEIRTYEAHKQDLLRDHEGEFVLIKGTDIIGIFPTRDEAMSAGYRRYLLMKEPFLMRQILPHQKVYSILSPQLVYDD